MVVVDFVNFDLVVLVIFVVIFNLYCVEKNLLLVECFIVVYWSLNFVDIFMFDVDNFFEVVLLVEKVCFLLVYVDVFIFNMGVVVFVIVFFVVIVVVLFIVGIFVVVMFEEWYFVDLLFVINGCGVFVDFVWVVRILVVEILVVLYNVDGGWYFFVFLLVLSDVEGGWFVVVIVIEDIYIVVFLLVMCDVENGWYFVVFFLVLVILDEEGGWNLVVFLLVVCDVE